MVGHSRTRIWRTLLSVALVCCVGTGGAGDRVSAQAQPQFADTGTIPIRVVNGRVIEGAQPAQAFVEVIEPMLRGRGLVGEEEAVADAPAT